MIAARCFARGSYSGPLGFSVGAAVRTRSGTFVGKTNPLAFAKLAGMTQVTPASEAAARSDLNRRQIEEALPIAARPSYFESPQSVLLTSLLVFAGTWALASVALLFEEPRTKSRRRLARQRSDAGSSHDRPLAACLAGLSAGDGNGPDDRQHRHRPAVRRVPRLYRRQSDRGPVRRHRVKALVSSPRPARHDERSLRLRPAGVRRRQRGQRHDRRGGVGLAATRRKTRRSSSTLQALAGRGRVGLLVVTPVIVTFCSVRPVRFGLAREVEAVLGLAVFTFVCLYLFNFEQKHTWLLLKFPYVTMLPFLLWAALRFDLRITTVLVLIMIATTAVATVRGSGPMIRENYTPLQSIITLQLSSILWGISALVLTR